MEDEDRAVELPRDAIYAGAHCLIAEIVPLSATAQFIVVKLPFIPNVS
jgi:hypothetical protein